MEPMPNQPMRRICTTSINRAPVFGSSLCATSFWIQPLCNQILVPASVQPVFGSSLCATSFWIQPLYNQFLDPASVQPVLGESLSYKECESLRIALIFCYRTKWMLWFLIWEQTGCCDFLSENKVDAVISYLGTKWMLWQPTTTYCCELLLQIIYFFCIS